MLLPYQPDYKQDQLKVPGTGVCAAGACNGQHSHQVTPLMVINNSHQRVSSCLMKYSAFQLNANETRTKTKHSRASVRRECMIRSLSLFHVYRRTSFVLFSLSVLYFYPQHFIIYWPNSDFNVCLLIASVEALLFGKAASRNQLRRKWHSQGIHAPPPPAFGCDIVANESAVRRATYRLPVNYIKMSLISCHCA